MKLLYSILDKIKRLRSRGEICRLIADEGEI